MNRTALAVGVAVAAVVAALGIGWTIGNAWDGQGPVAPPPHGAGVR